MYRTYRSWFFFRSKFHIIPIIVLFIYNIYYIINDRPRWGAFTADEAGSARVITQYICILPIHGCLLLYRLLLYYVILLWCTVRSACVRIYNIIYYRKARARAKHTNDGVCSRSWRRRRVVGACGGSRAYGVFAETRTRARPLVVCLSVNYTRTRRLVPSRRNPLTRVHRVCSVQMCRPFYHRHRRRHHNV